MATIEKFFFHPRPHALTAGIVVAASPGTVHALADAVFSNRFTVGFAGVLCSTAGLCLPDIYKIPAVLLSASGSRKKSFP